MYIQAMWSPYTTPGEPQRPMKATVQTSIHQKMSMGMVNSKQGHICF